MNQPQKKMATQTILNIANLFLHFDNSVKQEHKYLINLMKLQKLCYYAQGFCLALYDSRLFAEDMIKSHYGPYNEKLNSKYHGCCNISLNEAVDENSFTDKEKNVVKFIHSMMASKSGGELENMIHKEEPNEQTKFGHVITEETFLKFFNKRFAPIELYRILINKENEQKIEELKKLVQSYIDLHSISHVMNTLDSVFSNTVDNIGFSHEKWHCPMYSSHG